MAALEYPEQTYRPGCKIRLIIRFDEYAEKEAVVKKQAPKVPVTLAKGVKDARGKLKVEDDPTAPVGVKRFRLVPQQGATSQGLPQKQDSSSDKLTQIVGGIIPVRANCGFNGTREADTLTCTIRYVDCPIDPRTIRAAAVEFFLGTLTENDFQAGVAGGTKSNSFGGSSARPAEPLNVIPDEYQDEEGNQRTNLRFQGWVDKWETNIDDSGEPVIELECRDNTTIFIDQAAPPKACVAAKDPIDKAIADYLSMFPQMAGMSVEYRPGGLEVPALESVLAKTAFRPKGGPGPTGGSGDKLSVWDYLTDICGSIGHNVRVDGTTIVIQRVRTLYSKEFGGRSDDPFQGRKLPSGKELLTRYFIYGRNISSMRMSRAFSKKAPTNVEVRSYIAKKKTTLVARYPLKADTQVQPMPGDKAEQKWLVRKVSGIEDMKQLRLLAQSIYETEGRHELSVQLKTKNLASFGGGNLNPDILDMKAGDAFTVTVQRDDDVNYNAISNVEATLLVEDKAASLLKKLGFADEFAEVYAKVYAAKGFQSTFRLHGLGVTWDCENGVELDIAGVNYIEVRAEKLLPKGEEVAPAGSKKSGNQAKGT